MFAEHSSNAVQIIARRISLWLALRVAAQATANRVWITTVALLLVASDQAVAQERYVAKIRHPAGNTVVVAEGDFEARSIGSFSVRLYENATAPDDTTFFLSGLVRSRDGVIEDVVLADIDGDQQQEIVVVIRSVGSGSYLSAQAFAIAGGELLPVGVVAELPADADPLAALRQSAPPGD